MAKNSTLLMVRTLLTLAYTSQFQFPLTVSEIHQRLIGIRASQSAIKTVLYSLHSRGLVQTQAGYYMVATGKSSLATQLISIRHRRQEVAIKKWNEVDSVKIFLSKIPFILGVLITGSLAMNNTIPNDDIDFCIITKKNTLWIVRPLVVLYSWLNGKRRSWHSEEKNSWCFNLWLEEDQLQLPLKNRSIYSAYELCQAVWIVGAAAIKRTYYEKNNWAERYVPHYFGAQLQHMQSETSRFTATEKKGTPFIETLFFVLYLPVVWSNYLSFVLQYVYMLPHKTTERVGLHYAFFHPRDTRTVISTRWKATLQAIL
jgi:hypothetical protein